MLKPSYSDSLLEAGCDEAGRGCLAGPVFAAAVILPLGFSHAGLNDSKKLNARHRDALRQVIEEQAIAWSVSLVDNETIDRINILNASFLAMHRAIDELTVRPELLIIDGNRFRPYPAIPHQCIVKGDSIYQSIAAASILAKTHRDAYMAELHKQYPDYGWMNNKGYPTKAHQQALSEFGITEYHRKSFRLGEQLKVSFFYYSDD
ncbi:MAG: ribonuclease HII [Bacteroidales bacterium]|nr:ribonuclease HII [Bacteroidales bacterium]